MASTFKSKQELLEEINLLNYALINGYQIDKPKIYGRRVKLKQKAHEREGNILVLKRIYIIIWIMQQTKVI